jgi:DNA-directed RNA polymerase specialized sigma24 family protein
MNILHDAISKHYRQWQVLSRQLLHQKDLSDELLHDTLLKILETDEDVLLEIVKRDKLHQYVCNALRLACYGSKSSFNYKFMRFSKVTQELTQDLTDDITDDLASVIAQRLEKEQLDIYISRLPFFERELLYLYALDGFSYGELSKETGIPKAYLYKTIMNAKTILRNSITR